MTSSILHLSRNIDYLRVPAGLCDDHPNDGVDAVDLMGNIHLVPGLWSPVQGYGALVTRLERIGFHRALGGEFGLQLGAFPVRLAVVESLQRPPPEDGRGDIARSMA